MARRFSLTLAQVFALTLLALALLLVVLFYGVSASSRRTILDSSETLRRAASTVVSRRVLSYLDGAEQELDGFERRVALRVVDSADPASVERHLFAALADSPNAGEMAFTAARSLGFAVDGSRRLAEDGRWQVTVYRETEDPASPLTTLLVRSEGGRFVADERRRASGGALLSVPLARRAGAAFPPTESLTFAGAASQGQSEGARGRALWSDLSFLESDAHLPEAQRRVVVTAQRAVEDGVGRFVGVVRVGLRTEAVNRIVREEEDHARPYRLFLADEQGRLLTRPAPGDPLMEQADQSLRWDPRHLLPEVREALRQLALFPVGADAPATARFRVGDRDFLASIEVLGNSQDWRVGAVVAEDELPGVAELSRRRDQLLMGIGLLSLAILGGGLLTLSTVQSGLRHIDAVTARMQDFDFRRAEKHSAFRDVSRVMERLEQAKTALRALVKYVPVDLVRRLYGSGQEPVLGGKLQELSLMFTDVKDFTSLSESLPPDDLAALLGRYLEVMTAAIHATGGTVDKYVGDAIMALWNAPSPCPGHARRACEAALAAAEAGRALARAPEWGGRPALVTRFGLHRDQVLVGHFGAPDRLSYTALGDGVNLASRLEGLNKEYGTTILVTEAIREEAEAAFDFRLVDVVAVKGKMRSVRVSELLGAKGEEPRPEVARYEQAFACYQRRDFGQALDLLEPLKEDGPSRTLAERCRAYVLAPPPPDWDGTFVATHK